MDSVVDRLIARLATEPDTRRTFAGVNLANAKKSVGSQLCFVSGGGCPYEGETMAKAHRGLDISAAEFDGLIQILRQELWSAGVEEGPAEELIDLLTPMRADIVGHGEALAGAAAPPTVR